MTEGWGTVAAAAIGFAGLFVGLIVGRRQVRDQAQVEHGQWLRAQRQEAYVAFLDRWDQAVKDMHSIVKDWDLSLRALEYRKDLIVEADGISAAAAAEEQWDEGVWGTTYAHETSTTRTLERVQLLGPEPLEDISGEMQQLLSGMRGGILDMLAVKSDPDSEVPGVEYREAWLATVNARYRFLEAARDVTRTAPDIGKRKRWWRR